MRLRIGILIWIAAGVLSALLFVPANASGTLAPGNVKQEVVDRTNYYRQQYGCPALVVNSKLNTAAQGHSDDMAYNDFFDHVGSNGSTLEKRLQAVGYAYWSAGENIAAGFTTPKSVVDAWFNETPPNDGHRKNILNCSFLEIGIGYTYLANDTGKVNYNYYWVQDFGEPRSGVSPTATPTRTATPTKSPTPTTTLPPGGCNTKPARPQLAAPANSAPVNKSRVVLDWNDVGCATEYRVTVMRNATNGTLVEQVGNLHVSRYKTKPLSAGTYFWKVRACNAIGCKASAWRAFQVQ